MAQAVRRGARDLRAWCLTLGLDGFTMLSTHIAPAMTGKSSWKHPAERDALAGSVLGLSKGKTPRSLPLKRCVYARAEAATGVGRHDSCPLAHEPIGQASRLRVKTRRVQATGSHAATDGFPLAKRGMTPVMQIGWHREWPLVPSRRRGFVMPREPVPEKGGSAVPAAERRFA